MPRFSVFLHGTGCLIEIEERKWWFWRRVITKPVGFYTTRFVEAQTPNEAIRNAIQLVREELKAINLSESSPDISVEEITENGESWESQATGEGFSWYFEQQA